MFMFILTKTTEITKQNLTMMKITNQLKKEAAEHYINKDLKNIQPKLYKAFQELEEKQIITPAFYNMLGNNIILFYHSTFIRETSIKPDRIKEIGIILFYIFKLTLLQWIEERPENTAETTLTSHYLQGILNTLTAPRSV